MCVGVCCVYVNMYAYTHSSALDIIDRHWCDLVREQDFFATMEQCKKLLSLPSIPKEVRESLLEEFSEEKLAASSSLNRWRRLQNELMKNKVKGKGKEGGREGRREGRREEGRKEGGKERRKEGKREEGREEGRERGMERG